MKRENMWLCCLFFREKELNMFTNMEKRPKGGKIKQLNGSHNKRKEQNIRNKRKRQTDKIKENKKRDKINKKIRKKRRED